MKASVTGGGKRSLLAPVRWGASACETLLKHDAFPAGPLHKLIADIGNELTALDFTPQSIGYADPKIITKIERIQGQMASFVHDTPALVAQQPDGIGW